MTAPTAMHRADLQPIDDPGDPRLDRFRGLIARGDRPDPDCFFAESEVAVARLLASPHFTTLAVLGTPAHLGRLAPRCSALVGSRALLREVLGFDLHRGVIACAARPPALATSCPRGPVLDDLAESTCPPGHVLDDLAESTCPPGHVPDDLAKSTCPPGHHTDAGPPPLGPVLGASSLDSALAGAAWTVLLVQGLADPANLGSIIRSARAFAVDLVVLDRRGADPLSRRAIRGAMGHVFAQPLALAHDLPAALALLRGRGAAVWAATVGPRARPLGAAPRPDRLVVMVGNEGAGLPEPLRAAADAEVTIPLAPAVDSLGVAAATAVLLHALALPRLKPSPHGRATDGLS